MSFNGAASQAWRSHSPATNVQSYWEWGHRGLSQRRSHETDRLEERAYQASHSRRRCWRRESERQIMLVDRPIKHFVQNINAAGDGIRDRSSRSKGPFAKAPSGSSCEEGMLKGRLYDVNSSCMMRCRRLGSIT